MQDFDDPEVEAQWLAERREEIRKYLRGEGIPHGSVGDVPAWHVSPYVSVWAVESFAKPGLIGWWAICGDLPNDYVSANEAKNPREAVRAIASIWQEAAQYMSRGIRHPTFVIGSGDRDEELAPMLASRAELLLDWVADADAWDTDEG
ncbi:DUF4826 family protein [Xanthomonas massiliensis]|uniref:DUF4826 family protein n=1 Tax=Xanthomonas massiliensis TaxID=1720302 RepID=UPI00098FCB97|nr:DUF4826 family protein [Xanthomonas massiliensis]